MTGAGLEESFDISRAVAELGEDGSGVLAGEWGRGGFTWMQTFVAHAIDELRLTHLYR